MHKIGIDLGGTKIEGILVNDSLEVLERKREPTNQQNGYKSILDSIIELVNELRKKTNDKVSIGVCTPGTLSPKTGLIRNSNTQSLIGMPLKEDLEKLLGQKIFMENDANCFAMAEATMGVAKNYRVVFGVIMGTGVGGGIIINGSLHKGNSYIAGEWGHHTLRPDGNKCYCGKNGCVETCISGPALEKRWTEQTGRQEPLSSIIKNLSGKQALQWKKEFLDDFGRGLANVIDILDPDVIVLGGGVSNIPFLYDEGRDTVYEMVFSDDINTPILKNELGDSAGVFGACLLE